MQSAIRVLKIEEIVQQGRELGGRGVFGPMKYSLNPSKWKEIVQVYFPYEGMSAMSTSAKADFLASEYANVIFDADHFSEILIRLFLKWAIDLDVATLNEIRTMNMSGETQAMISRFQTEKQRLKYAQAVLNQVIDIVLELKKGDLETKAKVESLVRSLYDGSYEGYEHRVLLIVLGLNEKELEELAHVARLSPSLISYMAQAERYVTMAPLKVMFNTSVFTDKIDWARNPKSAKANEIYGPISKEFKKFVWRFVMVMAIHDLIVLPSNEAEHLLKNSGIPSLRPYLQKVFREHLQST